MAPGRQIILYHYTFSPYARRIVWYLNLRKIPYAQCLQPPIMPRPDVKALGVEYRRIPIVAIGRDIYHDTRLIIRKLEELFPASAVHPSISASSSADRAMERLLSAWAIEGGLFVRASQLLPTSLPLLQDPSFTKDRENYTGRSWSKDNIEANRPEALVDIKGQFEFLETVLLEDGREWALNTGGPSLSDIEAVWPFHWLQGLKDALPPDQISEKQFPKVFAWIHRFQTAVKAAGLANGKPKTVSGQVAMAQIGSSEFAEPSGHVDSNDPTGLKSGQEVEVWPTDSGFKNRDKGPLVGLTTHEIVIETRTEEGKVVRVHAPRHGFRVRATGDTEGSKL